MKFYIVIDNNPNPTAEHLQSEHGLSIYFNSNGTNFLVDTGASAKFALNLETLELPDIKEIDNVIISHGHNDHTGGLKHFLQENSKAKIILHNCIKGEKFFSCRARTATLNEWAVKEFRSIGMQQSLFIEHSHRFSEIGSATVVSQNVTVIPTNCKNKKYPLPLGNSFLYKNDLPDDFSHEVATLVEISKEQYVVVSPCSHNGILNILHQCANYIAFNGLKPAEISDCKDKETDNSLLGAREKIVAFIGGLHYVDYLSVNADTTKDALQEAAISATAKKLAQLYPNTKVYSGHCTCKKASAQLKELLKENYLEFYSGCIIEI